MKEKLIKPNSSNTYLNAFAKVFVVFAANCGESSQTRRQPLRSSGEEERSANTLYEATKRKSVAICSKEIAAICLLIIAVVSCKIQTMDLSCDNQPAECVGRASGDTFCGDTELKLCELDSRGCMSLKQSDCYPGKCESMGGAPKCEPSIGTFAVGWPIPEVLVQEKRDEGFYESYVIEFTTDVVLDGTLSANDGGDPYFALYTRHNELVYVSDELGDEALPAYFVSKGVYVIEVGASTELTNGYKLLLTSRDAQPFLGSYVPGEHIAPIAYEHLMLEGDRRKYAIEFLSATSVTGMLDANSVGDPDYKLFNSTGELEDSGNSWGDETLGPITLAPGVYLIEIDAFSELDSGFRLELFTSAP